jgi:hypothetical protein
MPTTMPRKTYQTVSPKKAQELGFDRVTDSYTKEEHWMLERAIQDLGDKEYLLVMEIGGISIFRKKSEIDTFERDRETFKVTRR